MILMAAKILAIIGLLGVYANNVFFSDAPKFAFFYQPNFLMLLALLFIAGTIFKVIRLFFMVAFLVGIWFYGYSYITGKPPLNMEASKSAAGTYAADCGAEASWYSKLSNKCY